MPVITNSQNMIGPKQWVFHEQFRNTETEKVALRHYHDEDASRLMNILCAFRISVTTDREWECVMAKHRLNLYHCTVWNMEGNKTHNISSCLELQF